MRDINTSCGRKKVFLNSEFFDNYKFRDRYDVGACCNIAFGAGCNTLTVEQIVRMCGVNLQIVIQAPKLACDISIVIKYILSDWVYRKSKMAAIFQDGHEQMHLTSSS